MYSTHFGALFVVYQEALIEMMLFCAPFLSNCYTKLEQECFSSYVFRYEFVLEYSSRVFLQYWSLQN